MCTITLPLKIVPLTVTCCIARADQEIRTYVRLIRMRWRVYAAADSCEGRWWWMMDAVCEEFIA